MECVLLVEPGYKAPYPPLGLMRISTWHKWRGDCVDFVKDPPLPPTDFGYKPPILKDRYDKIYICSLFTYHYTNVVECIKKYQKSYPDAEIKVGGVLATLLPHLIEEATGVTPHTGLFEEVEGCPPDYSLFPKLPYSISFTTRGCFRKCRYCVVSTIEPRFFVREQWEKDVNPKSERIVFWDNNWLHSPNFHKDIEKLKRIGKPYDFNQGLDCRLFDREKAELLAQTKIMPLRFAFDNPSQDGSIQEAIMVSREFGFSDIRIYVLYNSEEKYDTPGYFHHRINELNKLGVVVYPMKYRPINSTKPNWVSPRWDRDVLRGLKLTLVFFYKNGLIKKSRGAFLKMFGRNCEEFERKMKRINDRDRALWKEKRKQEKGRNEKGRY